MDITLTVAILGAAISILGWVVTYIFTTTAEKRRQRLLSQLDFTKQQLEELYGPLAFLILEDEQSYRDLLDVLGRDYVFLRDERNEYISEADLKTWLFWVENDFFPRHQKIKKLLSSKTHLIDGEKVPESFLEYMNHITSWRILHERWQKQGIPYSWHSKANFPEGFNKETLLTFEKLKKRFALLTGMVSEKVYVFHRRHEKNL
jgi:hypothetical protein